MPSSTPKALLVAGLLVGLLPLQAPVAQAQSDAKARKAPAKAARAPVASTTQLYRYRNERGIMVIDDSLPPDLARYGYDIISATGQLIERVAPEPTAEELAANEAARQAREEAARVAEREQSLRRRYRHVAEIEAVRDRVLRESDNQLNILRGNLNSQRSQIEVQQQRAADLERQGRPVPASMTTNIQALQQDIAATEQSIEQRMQEIDRLRAEYDEDIALFRRMTEPRGKPAQRAGR